MLAFLARLFIVGLRVVHQTKNLLVSFFFLNVPPFDLYPIRFCAVDFVLRFMQCVLRLCDVHRAIAYRRFVEREKCFKTRRFLSQYTIGIMLLNTLSTVMCLLRPQLVQLQIIMNEANRCLDLIAFILACTYKYIYVYGTEKGVVFKSILQLLSLQFFFSSFH